MLKLLGQLWLTRRWLRWVVTVGTLPLGAWLWMHSRHLQRLQNEKEDENVRSLSEAPVMPF